MKLDSEIKLCHCLLTDLHVSNVFNEVRVNISKIISEGSVEEEEEVEAIIGDKRGESTSINGDGRRLKTIYSNKGGMKLGRKAIPK